MYLIGWLDGISLTDWLLEVQFIFLKKKFSLLFKENTSHFV